MTKNERIAALEKQVFTLQEQVNTMKMEMQLTKALLASKADKQTPYGPLNPAPTPYESPRWTQPAQFPPLPFVVTCNTERSNG